MIYITGDLHGAYDIEKLNTTNFPDQKEMSKKDYLVILGDFGLVWNEDKENKEETYWLDWLQNKKFTTLFIDGNHENFDRLNKYPVEEWHGGKVHKIRPSVIHLMRGQVFDIDGQKCFTFGGAQSHDISDGIFDPNKEEDCEKMYRLRKNPFSQFRVLGVSWWKEELPSEEEYAEGLKNLTLHDYKVDLVFTHCCPTSTQALLGGGMYTPDRETNYLEEVRCKLDYYKWYFGHYHVDRVVNNKEICMYNEVRRIW